MKVWNLKPWSLFVFVFALACKKTCITTHSIESGCYRSKKYILFCRRIHACFSLKSTGWGSEGLKLEMFNVVILCDSPLPIINMHSWLHKHPRTSGLQRLILLLPGRTGLTRCFPSWRKVALVSGRTRQAWGCSRCGNFSCSSYTTWDQTWLQP